MNKNEIFLNIRNAYRLVYEAQKSMLDSIEYIKSRVKYSDCAGLPLFSEAFKTRSYVDSYANIRLAPYKWAWDYFPAYVFDYYFKDCPKHCCCMSIVQVMDNGFINSFEDRLDTSKFLDSAESSSFILFSFAKYPDDVKEALWYYNLFEDCKEDFAKAVFRISEIIDSSSDKVFDVEKEGQGRMISWKIDLCDFITLSDIDNALESFNKIIKERVAEEILK